MIEAKLACRFGFECALTPWGCIQADCAHRKHISFRKCHVDHHHFLPHSLAFYCQVVADRTQTLLAWPEVGCAIRCYLRLSATVKEGWSQIVRTLSVALLAAANYEYPCGAMARRRFWQTDV